jgi:hypothetical protein
MLFFRTIALSVIRSICIKAVSVRFLLYDNRGLNVLQAS